jgi:hypothetical protein
MAQEAMREWAESGRLVSTTGTRAHDDAGRLRAALATSSCGSPGDIAR